MPVLHENDVTVT